MVGLGQCTLDRMGELGAALGIVAGLAKFGNRLRRLPLLSHDKAELVVCLGVVGLEPDRRTEFGDRLVRLP
jgi:hypothetical protein